MDLTGFRCVCAGSGTPLAAPQRSPLTLACFFLSSLEGRGNALLKGKASSPGPTHWSRALCGINKCNSDLQGSQRVSTSTSRLELTECLTPTKQDQLFAKMHLMSGTDHFAGHSCVVQKCLVQIFDMSFGHICLEVASSEETGSALTFFRKRVLSSGLCQDATKTTRF